MAKFTARAIIVKRAILWEQNKSIEKDSEFRQAIAEHMLTEEGTELRQEVWDNPEYLVEMFFVIVDKEMQTVPFFYNRVQRKFMDHLVQAIKDKKAGLRLHLKFLVLKGRQQGFTTVITAYQLARAITQKNFSGITIADEGNNATTIFEKKAKYPYINLPEIIKPTEKFNNRRELMFSNLNSSWYISTAGNKEVGRSNTLNFFHGSEAALWDSISHIITGLGEALTKDSIQILESTANGFNEYEELWDGAPNNTWEALFYQWWETPEYRIEYESEKAKKSFEYKVTAEDGDGEAELKVLKKMKHLLDTYQIEWSQLYWYYNKWKGYIDKDKIMQEYPCNPREAFLASGRCIFNTETILNHIDLLELKYKKEPPKRGFFKWKWHNEEYMDHIIDSSIEWVNDPQGIVTIYEEPIPGIPYAISGDTKGEGKDFYGAACKDNTTGIRNAYVHGQFYHSKPYTHQVYCLGRHYNDALIGIEMNFNTAPIEELDRLGYLNQYFRKKYDAIQKTIEPRFGWKTDGTTRPYMIDQLIEAINERIEQFPHIPMLQECLTFIYNENNRPEAEAGKHDDLVISDAILDQISTQQTTKITAKTAKLEGYYTESELEDKGYSKREIKKILESQTSYKK